MAIVAMMGIDALHQRRRDPRRLSPARLIRALRTSLLRGGNGRPTRVEAALQRALANAVKDDYQRHASKCSRHRPITKNTPYPLVLKPPRLRRATPRERQLARNYRPPAAA
jgi:hypothetical protein